MKFKFHWGHAMVLAMVLFIVFILSMFFQVKNIELVKEEYYIPDSIINIQVEAQKRVNTLPDSIKPKILLKPGKGLLITFPNNWSKTETEGYIELMRPSAMKDDINQPIKLDSLNQMLIPKEKLKTGLYFLTFEWSPLGKNYRYRIKDRIDWKP